MEKNTKININNINLELPLELIQLIFSKLPFVNLPSCRLVCKAWNNLVLTFKFHPSISISNLFVTLNYSYDRNIHCVDLDPKHLDGMSSVAKFSLHPKFFSSSYNMSIINSCGGLLCCSFYYHVTSEIQVWILNPMTNEYLKPPYGDTDRGKTYYYGFGFSPKTKQYKIARVSWTLVEIFAFGTSRKWTPLGFLPRIRSHGVYFNGGLFWAGTYQVGQTYTNVIYRLDVEEEKFREISFPQLGSYPYFIGVFNGTLYLTLTPGIVDLEYCVWKMEEDFSWTKAFDVHIPKGYLLHPPFPLQLQLQLIRVSKDGKILCLVGGFHFVLYDPKTKRSELFTNQDFTFKKVHLIDSFNFDSLHNILGVDA